MQRSTLITLVSILLVGQCSSALASGGYSGNGGFNNSRGGLDAKRKAVDQNYELGKSIYRGRKAGEPALEYCVLVEGEKVPLKRKSIKAYKNATYNELATGMYQCDQPEKPVSAGLSKDSFLYVLYYLNKRHKLNLKGA